MDGVLLLALILGVATLLVLYVLIADETASTEISDRETAERQAREFGGMNGRSGRGGDRDGEPAEREDGRFDGETRR